MTTVRRLEPKKVPEIQLQTSANVSIPQGVHPEEWLKTREKTVLAGQLFREHQFFLALNIVHEVPEKFLLLDYQLVLLGLWCYLNLGLYAAAETYCENILKTKNVPGLRRGLLMALHMQGKYTDAVNYISLFSPEEQQEMAKLIQEVKVAHKNQIFPPYICAIGGHTAKMQQFLEQGGNPNEVYQAARLGPGHPSLLHLAAANGQNDVVRLLCGLDNKNSAGQKSGSQKTTTADVTFENIGWSPLHIASYLGYTPVVSSLVEAGAEINRKMFGKGSDALQLAIIGNKPATIRYLIASQADINTPMPVTPNLGIVENFVLVPGTTACQVDALQGSAYWHAAAKGRINLLKFLIEEKIIDVNIKNKLAHYASFLHFATGRGIIGAGCDFEMTRELLELKADVNCQTESGYTPLHFACRCADHDTLRVVQLLLDAGANINAMSRFNETPLVCALSAGNADVSRELITRGADIALTEQQIKQPIIAWCVLSGNEFLVKSVMEGFVVFFRRQLGLSDDISSGTVNPFSRQLSDKQAESSKKSQFTKKAQLTPEQQELDKDRKAKLAAVVNSQTNKVGMSALHWSCLKGDWLSVSILLKYGANPKQECEFENIIVTPTKCCSMAKIGKAMGADPDDMQDCLALIEEAIAIAEGRQPKKPEIIDIPIEDDYENADDFNKKLSKRQNADTNPDATRRHDPEDGEGELSYYDELYFGEGEGEFFWDSGEGEEWFQQFDIMNPANNE